MAWYIPQDLSSYMNPGEDFLVKRSRGALGILGGGTSDQKMLFSTPVFRPGPWLFKSWKALSTG